MSRLDNMVTRMIEPMLALNLVADPPNPSVANTSSLAMTTKHLDLAAEIAGQSLVMLKNEKSILPIRSGASVATFGNPWWRFGKGSGGVQSPYVPGAINKAVSCKLPDCNPATAYLPQILVNAGHTVTVGSDGAQVCSLGTRTPFVSVDFHSHVWLQPRTLCTHLVSFRSQ
jgi:hypothetical protein